MPAVAGALLVLADPDLVSERAADDRRRHLRPLRRELGLPVAAEEEHVRMEGLAVAVRELVYDADGQVVKQPKRDKRQRGPEPIAVAAELEPGQTRKETEGVFVFRGGRAEFVPIKMGIAGDKYFEVLSGLKPGDQVVTGPYNSVRAMADGDAVKVDSGKAQQNGWNWKIG